MPEEIENTEEPEVEVKEYHGVEDIEEFAPEEETAEALKAKIAEMEKALEKANKERARLGRKAKETPKEVEVPVLTDAAKKAFVVAELKLNGLDDAQARKFSRLVELADIDLDEDGSVVGIDLDDIKEDFPELFNKTSEPVKKPVRKVNVGDSGKNDEPPTGLSDVTKKMFKMAGRNY